MRKPLNFQDIDLSSILSFLLCMFLTYVVMRVWNPSKLDPARSFVEDAEIQIARIRRCKAFDFAIYKMKIDNILSHYRELVDEGLYNNMKDAMLTALNNRNVKMSVV